jgi:TPR repeat protein
MKIVLLLLLSSLSICSHAQSARQLTRRIAPQLPPPIHHIPTRPGPGQPAASAPLVHTGTTPNPAQKAEADKKLLTYQMGRAEAGSESAQYELGLRYLAGNGVAKDEKIGLEWLNKAATNGSSLAKRKLSEIKPVVAPLKTAKP